MKKPTRPGWLFAFPATDTPDAMHRSCLDHGDTRKNPKNFHVEFNTTSKTVVLYS
jgi:hypothetical protein